MSIAIPLQDATLANHFTKATCFGIYDEFGSLITQFDNPALESGCSGKHQLIEKFAEHKVNTVVVKNIGERMLGKLLGGGVKIKQVTQRNQTIPQLLNQLSHYPLLTEPSQGRASVHYQEKQQQGRCCDTEGTCCSHHQSCDSQHQGRHGCGHH